MMNDLQIADPVVSAYVLLLNTSDMVARYVEMRLSKLGITSTQFVVLMILSVCAQPPTLTDLGQRLFRSKNGLTTVIDNMEKHGLVKRVRDHTDRRAIKVVTTKKGAGLLERVRTPSRELVHEVMSCCSEEDLSRLSEILQNLRRHILQELGGSGNHTLNAGISRLTQSQTK